MNEKCPTDSTLSAYHDGEITGDELAAMARHLAWCMACAARLEQLMQMSAFITSGAPNGLSQIAVRRLHDKLDEVIDYGAERGLVRWAWEVGAIAAAILLAGSVWLTQLNDPKLVETTGTTALLPPWVGAQASADPVIQEAPTPAAVWYLADARNTSEFNP